jgi:3-deoxy-D-manno-octulosonic acid kinase
MSDIEIHRAGGEHVLYDRARVGGYDAAWFDAERWQTQGSVVHSTKGRGAVLKLEFAATAESWVLRHYHRGGLVSRLIYDHYLWTGAERSRAFREWRLLYDLHRRGFPVPEPLAARVVRQGPFYQADIVLAYLPDTRTLSAHLNEESLSDEGWRAIGAMLRSFHEQGVDHPDLTAHNILLGAGGRLYLVDFDNATMRPPGPWRANGLARFQRSLRKVALETGTSFDDGAWADLIQSYEAPTGPES